MPLHRLCGATFACLVLFALHANAEEVTWPMMLSNRLELHSVRVIHDKDWEMFNPLSLRMQARVHHRVMLDL